MFAAPRTNGHQEEAIELSDLRPAAQPAGLRAGRADAAGVEAYDAAFLASLRPVPPPAPRRRRDRLQAFLERHQWAVYTAFILSLCVAGVLVLAGLTMANKGLPAAHETAIVKAVPAVSLSLGVGVGPGAFSSASASTSASTSPPALPTDHMAATTVIVTVTNVVTEKETETTTVVFSLAPSVVTTTTTTTTTATDIKMTSSSSATPTPTSTTEDVLATQITYCPFSGRPNVYTLCSPATPIIFTSHINSEDVSIINTIHPTISSSSSSSSSSTVTSGSGSMSMRRHQNPIGALWGVVASSLRGLRSVCFGFGFFFPDLDLFSKKKAVEEKKDDDVMRGNKEVSLNSQSNEYMRDPSLHHDHYHNHACDHQHEHEQNHERDYDNNSMKSGGQEEREYHKGECEHDKEDTYSIYHDDCYHLCKYQQQYINNSINNDTAAVVVAENNHFDFTNNIDVIGQMLQASDIAGTRMMEEKSSLENNTQDRELDFML